MAKVADKPYPVLTFANKKRFVRRGALFSLYEIVFPETQLEIMKYVLVKAFSLTFGDAGELRITRSESN